MIACRAAPLAALLVALFATLFAACEPAGERLVRFPPMTLEPGATAPFTVALAS